MEKVKLTQSQYDSIGFYADMLDSEAILKRFVNGDLEPYSEYHYENIKGLTAEEMIQILLNQNYEVEITYHLKEMVVYEGEVLEIVNIPNIGRLDLENDRKAFVGIPVDKVRHATKEEIWWAEHGRKPWELKEKDLLKSIDEGHIIEVSNATDNGRPFFVGGTHPMRLRHVKDNYVV